MKACVRRVGTKVCYTFPDEKFFFCYPEEAEDDLARASQTADGWIEVDDLFYLLAR